MTVDGGSAVLVVSCGGLVTTVGTGLELGVVVCCAGA